MIPKDLRSSPSAQLTTAFQKSNWFYEFLQTKHEQLKDCCAPTYDEIMEKQKAIFPWFGTAWQLRLLIDKLSDIGMLSLNAFRVLIMRLWRASQGYLSRAWHDSRCQPAARGSGKR
jgi:hypothetical protein